MKELLIILLSTILFTDSYAQKPGTNSVADTIQFRGSELQNIEVNLVNGDKTGLFGVAPFLDSNRRMIEFLGYHILHTSEREIARRLLYENCTFLDSELRLNDSLSAKQFLAFLHKYYTDIKFDKDAEVYLITPLINRTTNYEIRELTSERKAELKNKSEKLLKSDWVKKNNIDKLVNEKNPYALFEIAATLYRDRERFNYYNFSADEYIGLLEILTGVEIGIEDEHHNIDFHIDKDFDATSKLNLLIYFAKNYPAYKWDENLKTFHNNANKVTSLDPETKYFQLLNSNIDSIAFNAFIKLTTSDPDRVAELADEYNKADISTNYSLPTFPYRFLTQLAVLTAYCKNNNIDFIGSKQLIQDIVILKTDIPFEKRRQLEDKMVAEMTMDDITPFEYWSLVFESNSYLSYSAGRILNIFYSNNWNKIISNKKYLDAYLKKSILFERLGIIGICNNFTEKFIGADTAEINIVKHNTSSDKDIAFQSIKALKEALTKPNYRPSVKKSNDGNYDSSVIDLEKEFSAIIKFIPDSEKQDKQIAVLFSKINYSQIGQALKLVEGYKFKYEWDKYSFIERDFGFFMDDFEKPSTRKTFLAYYSSHTEKQVYGHYLVRAGIVYTYNNKSLNYDKIYELLKYDVVTAFVGAGGAKQDNEVYCLIKLLEMKFKTTLGFPSKLCNSQGTYGCNSTDRAKFWMSFLKEKGLLKLSHNTPISFSFYDR